MQQRHQGNDIGPRGATSAVSSVHFGYLPAGWSVMSQAPIPASTSFSSASASGGGASATGRSTAVDPSRSRPSASVPEGGRVSPQLPDSVGRVMLLAGPGFQNGVSSGGPTMPRGQFQGDYAVVFFDPVGQLPQDRVAFLSSINATSRPLITSNEADMVHADYVLRGYSIRVQARGLTGNEVSQILHALVLK